MGETQFKWGQKTLLIVMLLVSVALLASLSYYIRRPSPVPIPDVSVSPTALPASTYKDEWEIYHNVKYGYQFLYPPDWRIWGVESPEEAGTTTGVEWGVSLKAPGGRDRSLDISVWPEGKREPFIIDEESGIISGTLRAKERWQILFRKELGIGDVKTTLYTAKFYKDCEDYFIRIPRNDYVYWFNAFCDNNTGRPHELTLQIISTFKNL